MNKITAAKMLQKSDAISTSSSLVAKAGQIMAIIIAFGLISMISSMLVSENLSGDAAQINHAGALRMMSIRVSRAHLLAPQEKLKALKIETALFDHKLSGLFSGGLTNVRKNPEIENIYQQILKQWVVLKKTEQKKPVADFDEFVTLIDRLVTLLQLESEKKLSFLRSIQGIGLFSILIISFIVLIKLNRTVITPLKQLVKVADEVGKGNFDLKADYQGDDELGVLALAINQMSEELQTTYQNFEQRVANKTKALTHSNQSLQVLYHAANSLAFNDYHQTDQQIIEKLQTALGFGKISIEKHITNRAIIDNNNDAKEHSTEIESTCLNAVAGALDPICLSRLEFPLVKPPKSFGYLIWQFDKTQKAKDWQLKLLKTMADIVATAIELEQKRNIDDRLLIMEERAVIARELHDSLAQSLSYLKVQMSLLTRKMQKDATKEQLSETIEDIKEGLNNAYQQLRELLTTFRLKLDDPSLKKALQGTVAEFSAKCLYPVTLDFQIADNCLSANQEIHVLQIVREALSNVHRHAEASDAKVSIKQSDNKVKVIIWDNGRGITQKTNKQGHFGLGIMEERAKSLNAQITLNSDVQTGTQVIFEIEC